MSKDVNPDHSAMVYKFNGRRISRDLRLRKWDENWNELLLATLAGCVAREATLTWALMGLLYSRPWQ